MNKQPDAIENSVPFMEIHHLFDPSCDLQGRGMGVLKNPPIPLFPKVPHGVDG